MLDELHRGTGETGHQGSRYMSKEQEEELQHFVLYEPKLAEKVKEDRCRS